MELCLAREAQAGSGVERHPRDAVERLDIGESRAMRGLELAREPLFLVVAAEEEVSIDALEGTVDSFAANDRLDAVDRRTVARCGDARSLLAMELLESVEAVIHRVREVRGRAPRLAPTDLSIIQHDDAASGL